MADAILETDLSGPVAMMADPGQVVGLAIITNEQTGARVALPFGPHTQVKVLQYAMGTRRQSCEDGNHVTLRVFRIWGDQLWSDGVDAEEEEEGPAADDGLGAARGMRNAALIFFAAAAVMWFGYLSWLMAK